MITEETIKQTKFYQDQAEQQHLVTEVRSVKLVTLINCKDGVESKLLLGDDVCSQFTPCEASFNPFVEKQVVVRRPKRKEPDPGRKSNTKTPSARSTRKGASNRFKGVKKEKPYSDGRKKFSANYRLSGKGKYLGTFENEFLAAAAVQEKIGNKDEAKRLRNLATATTGMTKQQRADMDEQAENNPNRPGTTSKKKGKTIWVCKKCGVEYMSEPKFGCLNCRGDDFREVPGGGD